MASNDTPLSTGQAWRHLCPATNVEYYVTRQDCPLCGEKAPGVPEPAKSAPVVRLRDHDPLMGRLQDDLRAVILQERYDGLSIGAVVGVLEFLKFNLINDANR